MKFDEGWVKFLAEELSKQYFSNLAAAVQVQRDEGKIVYPPEGKVFEAFKLTPFADLKVVIVGSEPYSKQGLANGLAFSVSTGANLPSPIKNIYRELHTTLKVPVSKDGDLSYWAKSGILLLNSVLTVEKDKPKSHVNVGWERFTNNCVKYISANSENKVVFCLWGEEAQKKAVFIDREKHLVLKTSHPDHTTVNQGFSGCGHFVHINQATEIWG